VQFGRPLDPSKSAEHSFPFPSAPFGGALRVPPFAADEFKELVRSRTDIVSLIAESVALQSQRGGREFVGLCPFHDDHNPSMRVYPDRQSYRCWVCNEGGDCFSFVMKRERFGFREALEMLAGRANMELPKQYRSGPAEGGDNKNRLYEILAWAEQEFHECLLRGDEGERARKYLRERGITGQSIAKFRLGYHPRHWEWLIEKSRDRFSLEQLANVRLVQRRDGGNGFYDYFVDRVLFPIRDTQGRAVAFGGRVLPGGADSQGPKYWNSPESVLFNKSRFLYGLDQARDTISKSETAVVVEGYTDCILAHQQGLTNFVATLGTALNENHVMNLKRFARRVVLVYDGDKAGRDASERALPRLLAHEVDLRILPLPGGLDPADFVVQHGGPALQALLDQAVEAWDQKFRMTIDRHGLDSIDARHRVLEEMLDVLAQVPVSSVAGLAGKWQERESVILGQLAQRLRVTEEFARQRLGNLRTAGQQRGAPRAAAADDAESQQRPTTRLLSVRPNRDEIAERELLEILFTLPERVAEIHAEIRPEDVTNPHLRQLLELCLELGAEGVFPSYERVTTRLEDAALKNLAAQIDEHARAVRVTPELLAQTLGYFRRRREARLPSPALLDGPHGLDPPAGGSDLEAKARLRQAMEPNRKRATRTTLQ
jgi:DNA primase